MKNTPANYLEYSQFTYPGLYEDYLKSLPDDIRKLGVLIRNQLIHRTSLADENTNKILGLIYVDMKNMPWWRQAEDDNFNTAVAIIAELFRRDPKGLTLDRKVEDKVVLTCRYITILFASILKSKGIPARVRSGFAGYWPSSKVSSDHWINQYWSKEENRWVTIDIDGSLHKTGFDMYNIPDGKFDYAADAWLNVREGKIKENYFWNADGSKGLLVIAWELFYDFHCLMNNEIIYLHHPKLVTYKEFKKLSKDQLREIDHLARLMQQPDENFDELKKIWETNREFRILKGALL